MDKEKECESVSLVSVIIISYQVLQFIYEAIDSVLCQSYGAVELLICDDGSEYFPKKQIAEYIHAHKRENIWKVQIHHEKTNAGTVRNINRAIHMVHGDYIGLLAADDAYYDERVLERFVRAFEQKEADRDCYLQMAQAAMCDYTLKRIDGYALFQNVREAAEKGGTELFDLLGYCECLPTVSFFYKREFFEKFGDLDEAFYLIEDYPMHCRIVREGWKIHYENFAAVRHRNGGISRGNKGRLSRSVYLYQMDILKIREKYVKPYYAMLSREGAEDVKDKAWTEEKWIKSQLMLYENNRTLRRKYVQEYKWSICREQLCRLWRQLIRKASEFFQAGIFFAAALQAAGWFCRQVSADLGYAAFLTGMYRVVWFLSAAGIFCGSAGLLGKMIDKIECFPSNIARY